MTSDDRKGELFVVKNNPLFHQGRSGIVVRKLPLGTIPPDEEHVEVDWLNGNLNPDYENPVDVGSGHFRGIPYERKGKSVVKWINVRSGNLEETLNEEDLPSGGNFLECQVTVYEEVYPWIISTPFDGTSYRLDRPGRESIGVC